MEGFADYQPAGVAGLSPLQQFVMQTMLPGTLNAPYGMSGLLDLPGSVGPASLGVMSAGWPTQVSQAALQTLSPRLGSTPQSQGMDPFWRVVASMVPSGGGAPSAAPATSAFPGLTPTSTGAPAVPSSMTVPGIGGPNVDVSQAALLAPSAPVMPPVMPPVTPPPVATAPPQVPGAVPFGSQAHLDRLRAQAMAETLAWADQVRQQPEGGYVTQDMITGTAEASYQNKLSQAGIVA